MNKPGPNEPPEPFVIGEAFLHWLTAGLSERLCPDDAVRRRVEAWAKTAIPAAIKEAAERGDLSHLVPKFWEQLEVAISAHQAQHELANKLQGIEANNRAVKKALEAGDAKRATEEKGMFLLRFPQCRDLKHSTIQKMIENARLSGDVKFFIRFGRALRQKPRSPEETEIDKVTALITGGWIPSSLFKPGLCRLTDEALAQVCNYLLGRDDLSMAMVRKIRQRWKLKKAPKPWLKKVEKTAQGFFVS